MQGLPGAHALAFPGHDGEPWATDAFKNWAKKLPRGRKRPGQQRRAGSPGPFARAAGSRCSGGDDVHAAAFVCSVLLHEGGSVIYVARLLGHDAKLTLSTYGHVIDEFEDALRVPANRRFGAHRVARVGLVRDERRRHDCLQNPRSANTPDCAEVLLGPFFRTRTGDHSSPSQIFPLFAGTRHVPDSPDSRDWPVSLTRARMRSTNTGVSSYAAPQPPNSCRTCVGMS